MTKSRPNVVRLAAIGAPAVNGRKPSAFLPEPCPVTVLGKNGSIYYYLDASRQLVGLPDQKHSRLAILGLFGHRFEYLYQNFPKKDEDGNVKDWAQGPVSQALLAAGHEAGIWDASDRERGRGAWRGQYGELILHTGARVLSFAPNPNAWRDRRTDEPGLIGRYVYPAGEHAGEPAAEIAAVGREGAGHELLAALRTWNWRRPEIDPVLMLGWLGAAMMCGALSWRAIVWVTGGRGTGKSSLKDLIKAVSDETLLSLEDATESSVRQTLKHQTLPVLLDESESTDDNRKLDAMVKLARIAASGGTIGRGSADHTAVTFTMRSAFMFGSILIPPLAGQDRSRMAILNLDELKPGAQKPDISRERWAALGGQLRRRLIDNWWRWDATFEWYRVALAGVGHPQRGQDQFGTLLAAADMLLYDGETNAETGGEWVRQLVASGLAEFEDDVRDEDMCVAHILSTAVDPFRKGERASIAEWMKRALGWVPEHDATEAQRVLQGYGLRVDGAKPPTLYVANYHPALGEIFKGTHWGAKSGTMGVWVQALRRLAGAEAAPRTQYFAGARAKATAIPIASVPLDGGQTNTKNL